MLKGKELTAKKNDILDYAKCQLKFEGVEWSKVSNVQSENILVSMTAMEIQHSDLVELMEFAEYFDLEVTISARDDLARGVEERYGFSSQVEIELSLR